MTLDEALHEAVSGARMTAPHLDGVYVEHSFSRGFLRCWPVARAEDEPNRTQCAFVPKPEDRAATDWFEVPAPVYSVDHSEADDAVIKRSLKIAQASKWGKIGLSNPTPDGWAKKRFVRDKQAEALALMSGAPVECAPFTGPKADAYHATLPPVVPLDTLPPGTYTATFEDVKMTDKGPVVTGVKIIEPLAIVPDVPGKWGTVFPDSASGTIANAPKRDSWGRIIP